MRTILIPLILICSLAQFESVQAAKKDRIKLPKCNGEWKRGQEERFRAHSKHPFNCYAPEICTHPNLEGKSHTEGAVARVTNETDITDDCPAILRVMSYDRRVQVWLESFQDINSINSIEFILSNSMRKPENIHHKSILIKYKFSCQLEDGKIIGRYEEYPNIQDPHSKRNPVVSYIEDELPNKLTCKFDLKWPENSEYMLSDIPSFLIGGIETKFESLVFTIGFPACDPRLLYFNNVDEIQPEKLYERALYHPEKTNKIYCNDFYELELRKEGTSEYRTMENATCLRAQFQFNGENVGRSIEIEHKKWVYSTIDARCAAEAKYFCDYDVKAKEGKRMPDRVKPNWNPKRESSLKCPPNKPHLVVIKERSEKQIPNAKIECRNYGADQFWTVDGEILYEDGPVVYCTDTVECNRIHKIPASSVENGFLDRKDFLPRCYKNETLYVDDKKVLSKECDSTDGKFKYSVEEGVKLYIDEGTKFVCK